MSDVLERFHRTLVEEIRAHRPSYLDGPFTVAEIYQNLVPYGSHRDRIGVEMNGDYEDALLRLLAGEGDYLVLDSEHALRELKEELESSNPNTGLYREFAAVDVRLNPARLGEDEGSAPAGAEAAGDEPATDATSVAELAPDGGAFEGVAPEGDVGEGDWAAEEAGAREASLAEEAATASGGEEGPASFWSSPTAPDPHPSEKRTDPLAAPESAATEPDQDAGEEDEARVGGTCRWCRAELPDRDPLNFCPFCGTDVHLVPCPACGEELQPDWRFCVACGTEVPG